LRDGKKLKKKKKLKKIIAGALAKSVLTIISAIIGVVAG